jgi:predicted DNA-binding protein (MmcQ/YjbR family)
MTQAEFNTFCATLPAATHVVQWGGSQVWKVGGKIFCVGGGQDGVASSTFKVSEIGFEILKDQPGLRPAPYLASRGLKWIQHYAPPGLSDDQLRTHIRESHAMVTRGLHRKKRLELGLSMEDGRHA